MIISERMVDERVENERLEKYGIPKIVLHSLDAGIKAEDVVLYIGPQGC